MRSVSEKQILEKRHDRKRADDVNLSRYSTGKDNLKITRFFLFYKHLRHVISTLMDRNEKE